MSALTHRQPCNGPTHCLVCRHAEAVTPPIRSSRASLPAGTPLRRRRAMEGAGGGVAGGGVDPHMFDDTDDDVSAMLVDGGGGGDGGLLGAAGSVLSMPHAQMGGLLSAFLPPEDLIGVQPAQPPPATASAGMQVVARASDGAPITAATAAHYLLQCNVDRVPGAAAALAALPQPPAPAPTVQPSGLFPQQLAPGASDWWFMCKLLQTNNFLKKSGKPIVVMPLLQPHADGGRGLQLCKQFYQQCACRKSINATCREERHDTRGVHMLYLRSVLPEPG